MTWEMKFGIKASCKGCGEVRIDKFRLENLMQETLELYHLFPSVLNINDYTFFQDIFPKSKVLIRCVICTQQLTSAAGLGTGNKSEEGTNKFYFKDNNFHNTIFPGGWRHE